MKWLLSLGQKHGLPTSREKFPLFKYIADGEDLIQTNKNKEDQERVRRMLTTKVENHINKMRKSGRDKFVRRTVERTRTILNKNKNILILNADEGNVTVAMEKQDYKERMQNIVGD